MTLLPVLAADANLLLAIDDDQWMDSSAAAFVARAPPRTRQSRERRAVPTKPRAPPLALEDSFQPESIDRITVGPLSVGALQALVRERLGTVLARPMQVRLHEVSGGNPFYALELARAYGDRQPVDASAFDMPPSLERLVVARLGALDRETRDVLLLLAAHGRFPFDPVRAPSIRPEALDRALRAGVVEIADGLLRFTHPLLASAIYQEAADGERRLAHRRLAPVVPDPVHRARHLALGAAGPDADLAATIEAAAKLGRERGLVIGRRRAGGLRAPPDAARWPR